MREIHHRGTEDREEIRKAGKPDILATEFHRKHRNQKNLCGQRGNREGRKARYFSHRISQKTQKSEKSVRWKISILLLDSSLHWNDNLSVSHLSMGDSRNYSRWRTPQTGKCAPLE